MAIALFYSATVTAKTTATATAPNSGAVATIEVDAREAPRGIMSAHLELPVHAGPLTLVYPKWLPGPP